MKWIKQDIPDNYDFEGKIIEFSPKDHKPQALFCRCLGGFGSVSYTSGTMIIGDFYPTLKDAINETNKSEAGNTRAFPIAQYTKEE